MDRTCVTLCGMTQPETAAQLIVDKYNVEKGLAPRFLRILPKPVFKPFSALEVSSNETKMQHKTRYIPFLYKGFHDHFTCACHNAY